MVAPYIRGGGYPNTLEAIINCSASYTRRLDYLGNSHPFFSGFNDGYLNTPHRPPGILLLWVCWLLHTL